MSGPASAPIDAVTSSVLHASFSAIAEEMHRNLLYSAYSTIVRESRDASTALLTPQGELLAQGRSTIPMLLNAFTPIMRELAARGLLDEVRAEDAFVTNDPYGGAQHIDDLALVVPVFAGERLVGYAASLAHHLDFGAAEPGLNPRAHTVQQEGLRLQPMRIDLARDLGDDGVLTRVLAANIRVPEQTLGDIRAQIAAVRTGRRRLLELVAQHGADTVEAAMGTLLDYAETMMRAAVEQVPDGRYEAEEWLDTVLPDGTAAAVRIALAVTIAGSDVHVDLTGTAGQVDVPVNSPLGSTLSAVSTGIAMLIASGEVPVNSGSQRVTTVTVPLGTVLNPRFPAPVGARMSACFKLFDGLMAALDEVLPDRVIAPSYSAVAAVALSSARGGRHRIYREALGGGYGAGDDYAGASASAITLTNTANVPVEFAEASFDFFRVRSYGLRRDSGGGGQFGGGAGITKSYLILEEDVQFAAYSDHHVTGPAGLRGGAAGERAQFLLERDGVTVELAPLVVVLLHAGDVLHVSTSGGGGYRPPEHTAAAPTGTDRPQGERP